MAVISQLRARREEILRLAARHGAANVAIFGSAARKEETAGSDVDLLVDVAEETTPWFPAAWLRTSKTCSEGGSRLSSAGR